MDKLSFRSQKELQCLSMTSMSSQLATVLKNYLCRNLFCYIVCMLLQVRLKEYGSELIEVADNGGGIAPSDYHALTQKYHTSKLQQFTDLQVHLNCGTEIPNGKC